VSGAGRKLGPIRIAVVVLGALSMAPTAGDIGGCGSEVKALDPLAFALARKDMDCERCRQCSISSGRCERACDPSKPVETSIPSTCQPLLHDGEVCLRALRAASCDAYRTYVDELAPSTPSECEFCKVVPGGSSGPGFADAAARDGAP